MPSCVIYARVSTKEQQDEQVSLDAQRAQALLGQPSILPQRPPVR